MSDQQEGMEAMVGKWTGARGEKGDKGAAGQKGERGQEGLSLRTRYAIIVLFMVGALVGLSSLGLAWRGVDLANRAIAVTRHHTALCTAIEALAAVPPPAGNPATNPARAYDQRQHAIFNQLHGKFGC